MSIKSIRWKKWLTVAVVLGMIAIGPGRYMFLRYERDLNPWYHEQQRWAFYRSGTGLSHDLAVGKIRAGDTVETLKAKHPNLKYEEFERWTLIHEHGAPTYSDVSLTARDGKLVAAISWSCICHDVFFETRRSADMEEFSAAMNRRYMRIMCDRRDQSTLIVSLTGAAANVIFREHDSFYFPDLDNPPRD